MKHGIVLSLFLLLACLCLHPGTTRAQDTVYLLNGEVIHGHLSGDLGEHYRFVWNGEGKGRTVAVEKSEIFKIHFLSGETLQVYITDSANGRPLSPGQMWDFLLGEKMARATYKSRLPSLGGVFAGAASGLAGFWGLAIAPLYLGALSLSMPDFPDSLPIPSEVKHPEYFMLGYRATARKMKIQRAAITTLGGLVSMWVLQVTTGGLQ